MFSWASGNNCILSKQIALKYTHEIKDLQLFAVLRWRCSQIWSGATQTTFTWISAVTRWPLQIYSWKLYYISYYIIHYTKYYTIYYIIFYKNLGVTRWPFQIFTCTLWTVLVYWLFLPKILVFDLPGIISKIDSVFFSWCVYGVWKISENVQIFFWEISRLNFYRVWDWWCVGTTRAPSGSTTCPLWSR